MKNKIEKYSKKRKLNKKKYSKKRKLNKKKYSKKRKLNKKKYSKKRIRNKINKKLIKNLKTLLLKIDKIIKYKMKGGGDNGDKGDKGDNGDNGDKGDKGDKGDSAQKIYLNQLLGDILYSSVVQGKLLSKDFFAAILNALPELGELFTFVKAVQLTENDSAAPIFGAFIDVGTNFTKTQIEILNNVIPKISIYLDTIQNKQLKNSFLELVNNWNSLLVFYKNNDNSNSL